ncbi:DUF5959 family protein [Kitasatospora sp. NPDC059722]|uniref:DUF5959 family protein n=1 Tax=unclassified Kitasatospora TaxID=2633591 RepID=UPI00364E791C
MSEVASQQNELIRLADRPGGAGKSLRVLVLGRRAPVTPLGHGRLDCEIVATAEALTARFATVLTEQHLIDWEAALERLSRREAVRWLDEEHGPELRVEPGRPGGVWVTVSDAEDSGVTLRFILSLAPGWLEEQHALLKILREGYPIEAVVHSPDDNDAQ